MRGNAGRENAFSRLHPAVLMTFFLSELLLTVFLPHPVLQAEALVGGLLFCLLLWGGEFLRELGFYLPLFVLVALTNPLFSHNGVTPLFFLNGNPVTWEALLYGIFLAVSVTGVLFWCKAYSRVMTSDKFLYLFGKVAPRLSLVLSVALRFLPAYLAQSKRVERAQKGVGLYAGESFTDRIKNRLRVFVAMVSWSTENAMEVSASMKGRGYGKKGRTNFSLFKFTSADGVFLALILSLTALTLCGAAAGMKNFAFYPRVSRVELSPVSFAACLSFGLQSLLPALWEGKERILWKYYVSKI